MLEAAFEGRFEAAPLRFGEAISSRVEKAGAQYYALDLAQRHIDAGFAIGAHSVAGSKFKLLMFEANEAGQWELLLQEDSTKVRCVLPQQHHSAGPSCCDSACTSASLLYASPSTCRTGVGCCRTGVVCCMQAAQDRQCVQ